MSFAAAANRLRSASRPKQQQSSKPRSARKRVSYQEESSDTIDIDDDRIFAEDDPAVSQPTPRKPASTSRTKASKKRKVPTPRIRPFAGAKKRKTRHDTGHKEQKESSDKPIQLTGKTMPWATLPYQILLTIFDYASQPLISDSFAPYPSIAWLLHVARLCKAFAEPALSVLYYSPPLTPPTRAKLLLEHLAAQDERSTYNYRAKIKYLEVEAQSTLMHKYAGQDPIDLGRLVSLTPQLRGIGIHLLFDDPRFRKAMVGRVSRTVTSKFFHQKSLFSALQERQIMLRDWTWNRSLGSQSDSLTSLKEVHAMPPFQTLQDISFVNYRGSDTARPSCREEVLGEAINLLPNLTHLRFKMSPIVNHRLMPRLPGNLETLEIVDCTSLKSPVLSTYLNTGGRNLHRLILDHNQSLNLSFLTSLGIHCPKLEVLRMDLRYHNTFLTVRGSEPKYDSLFGDDEIPMWPASIQRLELFHLRKWGLRQAELFFSSLTEAAKSLSQLRQLRIKASIEESGWRERIGFRDKWTKNLQYVFKQPFSPPNPHLQSLAAFKAFKKQQSKATSAGTSNEKHSRLSRVAIPQADPKAYENENDSPLIAVPSASPEQTDSDAPLSKTRRSTRVQTRQGSNKHPSSSSFPVASRPKRRRKRRRGSSSSSSEDSALDDDSLDPAQQQPDSQTAEMPSYVQGMCDVVDVLIDNLRPTEEQLNEDDFLDEEVSGDEDWNGDDDDGEGGAGGGYAW